MMATGATGELAFAANGQAVLPTQVESLLRAEVEVELEHDVGLAPRC
jgi:hypothetical protein